MRRTYFISVSGNLRERRVYTEKGGVHEAQQKEVPCEISVSFRATNTKMLCGLPILQEIIIFLSYCASNTSFENAS
jgi:hypothetical protein